MDAPDVRASDADRERVIGTLTAAYVYGLVTKDEFDARVSQALASRTYAELAVITADIPAGLAPAPPQLRHAPARAGGPAAADTTARDRAIMAITIVAGLALVASLFASPAGVAGLPLAGLLVLGGTGSAGVALFLLAIQMRAQRTRRPGGQLPPQRGVGPGPGAAHRAISATSARRIRRTRTPRRPDSSAAVGRRGLRPQLSS